METKTALHREKEHIVWMDVVRLIAMFTVVCCHSADPFNFYAGETPPNIDNIKFWGGCLWSFFASLRAAFRHADRSAAASGEGNRHVRILQETHQPCFLAFPDLVGDIQPVSVDHRHTGPSAGNHS